MSRSKAKGTKYENEVRDALGEFRAYRCGEIVGHPGDVQIDVPASMDGDTTTLTDCFGRPLRRFFIECKRRAGSWKELYRWLDKNENDFLALRADRERTLIVMDIVQFRKFLKGDLPAARRFR